MHHHHIEDTPWKPLEIGGLEGADRVFAEQVHVSYDGREDVVEAHNFVSPLAEAAAEGLARLKLAEMIGNAARD